MFFLAWGVSWPMAAAAPWVQEEGALYTRVSIAQESVEGLDGWRTDAYAEYGLSSRITVTGKIEHVSYADAPDFDADGWRSSVRLRIFDKGAFAIAFELGLLEGAAIGGRNGCDTLGAEIRGGVAWSGQWQKRESFLFGEIARRTHDACQRRRFEFGFAQQTSKSVWSITQVWLERGDTNAASDKFQSELLWRTSIADLSLGYRNERGGLFDEESVFVAVARQF